MTQTTIERSIDDLLQKPAGEALPALRARGLLPATTTETVWTRDSAAPVQPAASAALAQLDPNRPFTAGKARLSAFGPQWYFSGAAPSSAEVSIRTQAGTSGGVLYFSFTGLGANRKCVAWVDLRVYGPGATSVTLGATGNPSTVVVSNQNSGGQRVSVPLALTAAADGWALAYMVPTLTGHGGAWYGTSVYGL